MTFSLDKALRAISERQEAVTPKDRPKIDPSSAEARTARSQSQEKAVVDQIEMLHTAPDSDLKAARLNSAYNRLAELYAEQGRYEEAIEVATDEKKREYYQSIKTAIEIPNDEICNCENQRAVAMVKDASGRAQNQEVTLPVRTEVQKIVTENGLASLTRCSVCGKLNAHA